MIDVEEMVEIPGGSFLMGTSAAEIEGIARDCDIHPSWIETEAPQREILVEPFAIDKYPVTRGQYMKFCAATGRHSPPGWKPVQSGEDTIFPSAGSWDVDLHPVVGVNWDAAKAYAEWAGKRLPTEVEWEKAARGTDGCRWPWGDAFNPLALNWNIGDSRDKRKVCTRPVHFFPEGVSPYGVWDMCGNVAEWTGDGVGGSNIGLIKSGGWIFGLWCNLRPAFHGFSSWPQNAFPFVGFRCAKSIP